MEPETEPQLQPQPQPTHRRQQQPLLGSIRFGDEVVVLCRHVKEVYAVGTAGFLSAVRWPLTAKGQQSWAGSRLSLVSCVDGMVRPPPPPGEPSPVVCIGDTVALKAIATGEFLCEDPADPALLSILPTAARPHGSGGGDAGVGSEQLHPMVSEVERPVGLVSNRSHSMQQNGGGGRTKQPRSVVECAVARRSLNQHSALCWW